MRRTFIEFVRCYAEENGCQYEAKEGTCQATLKSDGFNIYLGFAENSNMIIVQALVGLVPQNNKKSFYAMLLQKNNLFSGTHGMTLGINKEEDVVSLQLNWNIAGLDKKAFKILMDNVLILSAQMLEECEIWSRDNKTELKDGADTFCQDMNVLRI